MTGPDILYRAFAEMFAATSKDTNLAKMMSLSAKDKGKARITVYHSVCKVEDDWLSAIERGLVFIGKAIDEERQFIRSEGEVLPIENVKRVSKESIRHLSRHSDLISRKQSDEIVPDKLYTVERDSDFAVYENKFIYLLLCTIRDFVRVRYDSISSAYKEYRGEYEVERNISTPTRRLSYTIALKDEQDDVISAPADKNCAEALDRMDKILQSTGFYLRTPLMNEVSHSDKLNPPITKTNVLLMNKNFNEALLLYEFLVSYEEDGYTVEKVSETFDSLDEKYMREFALPPLLSAFLVYEHGLKMEEYLEAEYQKEEMRRKEEASRELERRIIALRKKLESTGKGAEEYALALAERIKELEKLIPEMQALKEENEGLKGEIYRLEAERKVLLEEIENLKGDVERLQTELKEAEERHRAEIERINSEHAEEMQRINAEHAEQLQKIKEESERNVAEQKRKNAEEIAQLKERQAAEISSLNKTHGERMRALEEQKKREADRLKEDFRQRLARGDAAYKQKFEEGEQLKKDIEAIKKQLAISDRERDMLQARVTALRKELGLIGDGDDFTTEEGFNALEHEFEVLGKLVREEWTEVKKILKKEFYANIRAEMRKKKAKKTPEYEKLRGEVLSRREEESEELSQGGEDNPQNPEDGEGGE